MLDFYSPDERAKIDSMKAQGFDVQWLSGLCPVQANGQIDGRPFYFRARHDEWSIRIAKFKGGDMDDVIDARDAWEHREKYGQDPDAGYMPFIEALAFIEWSAKRWRYERSGQDLIPWEPLER
jgi:hypothetical protein